MNLQRVASVATEECVKQQVGILGLTRLLIAYDHVYNDMPWISPKKSDVPLAEIRILGALIEPMNGGRLRSTPVTFVDGGSSCSPDLVPTAMSSLVHSIDAVVGDDEQTRDWVRQFLYVHPFIDGNGRTAWVLYNWLLGTLDNPVPLPDFDWSFDG